MVFNHSRMKEIETKEHTKSSQTVWQLIGV
jgi:hypothetical protein